VFLNILIFQNCIAAQDLDNVTISGRILDQNGAVISGASIGALQINSGATRTTTSDGQGVYRIIQLEPGVYNLRFQVAGFAKQEQQNLTLVAGRNLQIDITLYPQWLVVAPVLVTSAEAKPVDITRTLVGGSVSKYDLESLPGVTRSPLDLIFALPGTIEEQLSTRDLAEDRNSTPAITPEEAGLFSLSGGSAFSNNITIDGLDNNDDRSAKERFQPSIEAIEELQVTNNQFTAEYGRASGGRINVRTRSGSKRFSGRLFNFFRDESLNANTFRNNSLGFKRLPLQEHNPGFTLSGPAIFPGHTNPNHTFFFTSYEFDKVLDSSLIDTLVPVDRNTLFPLPNPTNLQARRLEDASQPQARAEIAPFVSSISTPALNQSFTTRLDHQFSETHNVTLSYQLGRSENLRGTGGGNRLTDTLQARRKDSDALAYSDSYVFSARLVNQARIQFSRLRPAVAPHGTSPVVLIAINDPLIPGDPARRSGTLVAGSSTTGASERDEDRLQAQDTIAFVWATHSLRFGFDTQRIRSSYVDLSDASGTFNFASAGDFLTGVPSRFRQNFLTQSTQENTYKGIFIQDEWQLLRNLLVSYGLRYETETIIHDRNNLGPRLSFAYDPFKTGKTVLRFGAGIFFSRALLRTIDDFTLSAKRLFFDTNALHNSTGKLFSADERRAFIASWIRFPERLAADSSLVRQFGVLNNGFSRRLNPALRIPESYQANLGLERNLGRGFVIEANYTVNRGLHLWREFNGNAARLPSGFKNFSDYLGSRDFPNFRNTPNGLRPLYNGAGAGELVRFVFRPLDPANPNTVGHITEAGVPISLVNLNSFNSTTAIDVALSAVNLLRPDPNRVEVEELIAAGNSFYQGLTVELRKVKEEKNFAVSFRIAYTISHLIDDGIVNTSDALAPGDFRPERALSLADRRQRLVCSGTFSLPQFFGNLHVSPIVRVASGAPFNISVGGADRNLDDVGNDRPIFTGDTKLLRWRPPGQRIDASLLSLFALPTIGQSGNLPRNAGHGPGFFLLDVSVGNEFHLGRRVRFRPTVEFDNILNRTSFSFGAEFINFNALAPTATTEQRQSFLDSFLVATRTMRQRQVRIGFRLDF